MDNINRIKKNELRTLILSSRDELDAEKAQERSALAAEQVIKSELFREAEHIMIFSSFRSEIDTTNIIDEILISGKILYMPLCMKKTNEIVTCRVSNLEALESSSYGILEPRKDTLFIGDCRDLDLIIVPGAAFDMRGHRIGYGAGYYDRLLNRPEMKAATLGFCYDLQIVSHVPNSSHDVSLDYIATEKGVFKIEG